MIELTLKEIADITKGELVIGTNSKNHLISQVLTDSRTFFNGKNAAFFALAGPRNNGHAYIPDLIEKGVSVFIISDKKVVTNRADFILVNDTLVALQELAAHNRRMHKYPVIGITGSNGKTIIKEWLHTVLSNHFKIIKSPKSFNSQVGVPLSVLLMTNDFDLGIFEAGISQPGEMKKLEEIISPEYGIFSNIGDAHQENFNSIEEKVDEKLNLFRKSKKLIYNADTDILKEKIGSFCDLHGIEQLSWSLKKEGADVRFKVKSRDGYTNIKATCNKKEYRFKIPFSDHSSVENSCHCFAMAVSLLKNPEKITCQFEKLEPVEMRLEIKKGINKCLLVNDYYNSDLNSLSIALSVLDQQAAKEHLSKLVIISDIQQTGMDHVRLYSRVNDLLKEWNIDEIIGVGPDLVRHANCFTIKKRFFESTDQLKTSLRRNNFSSSAILIKGARQFTFEKISGLLQEKAHQTELAINLNALVHNLNTFKSLLHKKTKIMVMVKAFSYGSGDVEIAKVLQYQNVDYLAVAIADEGVELRKAGIKTSIIVMNPEQDSFQNMIDYNLEPNIYSLELLRNFTNTVSANGINDFPIHIKIDTGMNRLGIKSEEEIKKAIKIILTVKSVKISSVFSHLAASDDPALDDFTLKQIDRFSDVFNLISKFFPYHIDRHILNSAGIERFIENQYDIVRLGIGLYGVSFTGLPVENIGTLKSTVSQVKEVKKEETIGYSRRGKIKRDTIIAVVPVGYADGIDRKLGNRKGQAFINGKRVPIIGNICMDMLMLDVTDVETKVGDTVEFFGPNISILEMAQNADTIPYEILTGISQRLKRVYYQE